MKNSKNIYWRNIAQGIYKRNVIFINEKERKVDDHSEEEIKKRNKDWEIVNKFKQKCITKETKSSALSLVRVGCRSLQDLRETRAVTRRERENIMQNERNKKFCFKSCIMYAFLPFFYTKKSVFTSAADLSRALT